MSSGNAATRGRTRLSQRFGDEDRTFRVGGGPRQVLCTVDGELIYHHVPSGRSSGRVALRTNDARATFRSATIYRLGGDVEVPPLASPRHRYSFDDDAEVLTALDSNGGKHGVLRGDITRGPGSVVIEGSGTGYVDLPNGMLSQYEAVTVEAWVTWDGPSAGGGYWQHLFDFGTTTLGELTDVEDPDAGLVSPARACPRGCSRPPRGTTRSTRASAAPTATTCSS